METIGVMEFTREVIRQVYRNSCMLRLFHRKEIFRNNYRDRFWGIRNIDDSSGKWMLELPWKFAMELDCNSSRSKT